MSDIRKLVGASGERVAKEYLERHGYEILETNFRCSLGEIDIIAREGDYLVFVEVRTRRNLKYGTPEESITPNKKLKLIELANSYLQEHGDPLSLWRIDIVAIELEPKGKIKRIGLVKNAID